ncbi:heterokaryon incompatibility protein-domain-containing protein [Nemania sp. FL0916]|nr:heterokaryon incompatibility protein-domain-containing protein [Nemania sp. FL0916]
MAEPRTIHPLSITLATHYRQSIDTYYQIPAHITPSNQPTISQEIPSQEIKPTTSINSIPEILDLGGQQEGQIAPIAIPRVLELDALPEYQYAPLRIVSVLFYRPTGQSVPVSRSIRVLEFLPGAFDEPIIACTIKSIEEMNVGKFIAISYTWGDSIRDKPIICMDNGRPSIVRVTSNCHTMLRHLRRDDGEYGTWKFWIDAICINQNDKAEKEAQIRSMGSIYNDAPNTVIFLGEGTEGSNRLFQYLGKIDQLLRQTGGEKPDISDPSEDIIKELQQLFQRPWFHRVWVIQELFTSRAIFTCGCYAATAAALYWCLYGSQKRIPISLGPPPVLSLRFLYFPELVEKARTPVQKMFILVASTGLCESGEARDRILALIPLIKQATYRGSTGVQAVDWPDDADRDEFKDPNRPVEEYARLQALVRYNGTDEEIFHEFADLLLYGTGLSLLWLVKRPRPYPLTLPSWIPDWTGKTDRSLLLSQVLAFFANFMYYRAYSEYETPSCDLTRLSPQYLAVKGVPYQEISDISPVLLEPVQKDVAEKTRAAKGLVRTIISIKEGTNIPEFWPDSIVSSIQRMKTENILDLLRAGHRGSTNDPENYIDDELGWNMSISCTDNVIFGTYNHGDIGLAPVGTQPGDIVCFIKGALMPCILRQGVSTSFWHLISGDCLPLQIRLGQMEDATHHNVFEYLDECYFMKGDSEFYNARRGVPERQFILW